MNKPIVLDLYGRKGGAAKGYQRAGFYVISVDIEDHSADNPADDFKQGDVITLLEGLVALADAGFPMPYRLVHASPPCQGQNTATACNRARGIVDDHPSLVEPTRVLLDRLGLPYVIEQPTSSVKGTIRKDITLCMDMFKGDMPPPWVQKHRSFELSGFTVEQPAHPEGPVRGGSMTGFPKPAGHAGRVRGWRCGEVFEGPYVAAYGKGGGKATVPEMQHAQQMPWVDDHFSLREAIPPAYTQYIGEQFRMLPGRGEMKELSGKISDRIRITDPKHPDFIPSSAFPVGRDAPEPAPSSDAVRGGEGHGLGRGAVRDGRG